jgi:hypothetical protein
MENTGEEKKKIQSLKFQFTLFFIFFIVAIYSIIVITSFQHLVGITETIGTQLGRPVVEEAAELIDGDAFERLSKSLDSSDPYYAKTCRELLEIKENSGSVYLYTMAPVSEDVFHFIIDGSDSPESDNFDLLGTEEDISGYKAAIWQTINTKSFMVSTLDFNTDWGWLVTAYGPILNSSGEVVGIIGCDFKADVIYSSLWPRILRQLILSAVFVLAGLAAYLYMVNNVNKQNQRLVQLKEEAERASTALKEERDTIAAMKDGIKIGLFFMDSQFVIQDRYSRALESVLSMKNLTGKKFTDILSLSIEPKEKASLIEFFVLLFKGSAHSLNKDMLDNLNPLREMAYTSPETGEEKILHCSFTPVDRGAGRLYILGTIQDYTAEKQMERKIAEEEQIRRDELHSLFEVIQVDPAEFRRFLDFTETTWDHINALMDDTEKKPEDTLAEMKRIMETLKVKSVELGLETYGAKIEAFIGLIQKTAGDITRESRFEVRKAVRKLMTEGDKFREIMKKIQSFGAWGIRKLD